MAVSTGADQIWTTKEGYSVVSDGVYQVSVFMFVPGSSTGYGALGFSTKVKDSNAGPGGAPADFNFGAYFHGTNGGFINNGPIANDGTAMGGAGSTVAWNPSYLLDGGGWFKFDFTATAKGSNKFDLRLKATKYQNDGTTAIGVSGDFTLTDDATVNTVLSNGSKVMGPSVTNTQVASTPMLHTYFSTEGGRITKIDNFTLQLGGSAELILYKGVEYSGTTFYEDASSPGVVTVGDTFTGTDGADWSSLVSNVPDGLTAVLTRTSSTTAQLSLSGIATNHTNADDVSNLTVTFGDDKFTLGNAIYVNNSTVNNLVIDYDPPMVDLNGAAAGVNQTAINTGSNIFITSGTSTASTADTNLLTGEDNLTSMTISIPFSQLVSEDTLSDGSWSMPLLNPYSMTSNFIGSNFEVEFADVSGVLTLTIHSNPNGTGRLAVPKADFDALLDSLYFSNAATDLAPRNFTVTFNDGGGQSVLTAQLQIDAKALTYSAKSFPEDANHPGQVTGTSTITLTGDAFTGNNGDDWSSLVTNVPPGLTAVLTRTSSTTAQLSFTGTAVDHANVDDVTNLTVTFTNSYFVGNSAAAIKNATVNNLRIDYEPPFVDLNGTTAGVNQSGVNDGNQIYFSTGTSTPATDVTNFVTTSTDLKSMSISIPVSQLVTGDVLSDNQSLNLQIYDNATGGGNVFSGSNVLEYVVTTTNDVRTLNFYGSQGPNVPLPREAFETLLDSLYFRNFSSDTAPRNFTVTYTDSNDSTSVPALLRVNPPVLTYSSTRFTEDPANPGMVIGTSTITLTNDTFTGSNGADWSGLVTNEPAGLTAVLTRTSNTTAELSFTGTATAHANANDVSNLTVTFDSAKFTSGDAAAVIRSTVTNLVIDYDPPYVDLNGSATGVNSSGVNDGYDVFHHRNSHAQQLGHQSDDRCDPSEIIVHQRTSQCRHGPRTA